VAFRSAEEGFVCPGLNVGTEPDAARGDAADRLGEVVSRYVVLHGSDRHVEHPGDVDHSEQVLRRHAERR
jgi:hypothetical protein